MKGRIIQTNDTHLFFNIVCPKLDKTDFYHIAGRWWKTSGLVTAIITNHSNWIQWLSYTENQSLDLDKNEAGVILLADERSGQPVCIEFSNCFIWMGSSKNVWLILAIILNWQNFKWYILLYLQFFYYCDQKISIWLSL